VFNQGDRPQIHHSPILGPEPDHPHLRKPLFYGRRKGRVLPKNLYQDTLDRLKNLDVKKWHGQWPKELWLEIGFGSGEHLNQWLCQYPQRSIIGVEAFLNGVIHCVQGIPESFEDRCAIFSDPVQELWPSLSESCLDGVILFFPDPWRKRRHAQRRMVQPTFLDLCAHYVKPGGSFHFASDHAGLIEHALNILREHPRWQYVDGARTADAAHWPQWPQHWPSSRYRDKAVANHIPCAFSIWQLQPS
jgi:tRNA (guanine-N7-)-methyltransferase